MIQLLTSVAIFLTGLVVGSFLNCLIYRLEVGQSFLKGRSFCPACKHSLSWQDLIPIFSFIFLKGKCRYCKKKISWQYPLLEAATGLLFLLISGLTPFVPAVVSALRAGQFFSALSPLIAVLYLFIVFSSLIVIFVFDLKHYLIPGQIVYSAIGISLFYRFFEAWNFGRWDLSGIRSLGLGILPSFFLLAIIVFSKGRWMGFGDFNLAVLMGLILGWPEIALAFFLSFLTGAAAGLGLMFFKKKTLKSEIPFGPFLVLGTFLSFFWASELIGWYEGLFLF